MKLSAKTVAALVAAATLAGCQTNPPAQPVSVTPVTTTADIACDLFANSNQSALSGLVRLTSAQPLRLGDKTRFRLSSNGPAYAQLYMLTASGSPVALGENLFLDGRQDITYPAPESGLNLTASPPAGTECVVMVLTRQPFAGYTSSGGTSRQPVALGMTLQNFVEDLNRRTTVLPGSTWTVAKTRFQTTP